MNNILALIHNQQKSKQFINYCAKFANKYNAKLELMYVQNPTFYPVGHEATYGASTIHLQQRMDSTAENARDMIQRHTSDVLEEEHIDIGYEVTSEINITISAVERKMDEGKYEILLVEGDDINNKELLSKNMGLIKNIRYPILVVPESAQFQSFNEIVYATDYNEEDISTLKRLVALTKQFTPKITALHITNSNSFEEKVAKSGFQELVQEKTGYAKITVEVLHPKNSDELYEVIQDYSTLVNANLMVVLKENTHFLDRIFKTSSTKQIVKNANVPTLIYHEHN